MSHQSHMQNWKYDTVISFAGEDQNVAVALSLAFSTIGIQCYYYHDFKAETWGEELETRIGRLYEKEAAFAVVLLSQAYLKKEWTRFELNAIAQRCKSADDSYILPILLERDLKLEHFPSFENSRLGYERWRHNPEHLAKLVKTKLQERLNLGLRTDFQSLKSYSPLEIQKVLRYYTKAAKLNKIDGYAHMQIGLVYLFLQNFQKSEKHLAQALDLAPDEANVQFYYGLSLANGKDPKVLGYSQVKAIESYLDMASLLEPIDGKPEVVKYLFHQRFYRSNGLKTNGVSSESLLNRIRNKVIDANELMRISAILKVPIPPELITII